MKNALLIDCSGAAHSNAFIDNCWSCAPFWGQILVCPVHPEIKLFRETTQASKSYCKECKKFYKPR